MSAPSTQSGYLPLRRNWLSRVFGRRAGAGLSVIDDQLELRVPPYFGRQIWTIPLSAVGVVDPIRSGTEFGPGTSWAFVQPVMVPYLAMTGVKGPNLILLFDPPQRIPKVPLSTALNLQLPYRKAQSDEGLFVDGVALRAKDGHGAQTALIWAGAESVERPAVWLSTRRPVHTGAAAVRAAVAAGRRSHRVDAIAGLAGCALLFVGPVASGWDLRWVIPACVVLAAIANGLPWWNRRSARRRLASDSADRGR